MDTPQTCESATVERFDTTHAFTAGIADASYSVTDEETLAFLTSTIVFMQNAGESTNRPMGTPRLCITLVYSDGSTQVVYLDNHHIASFDDIGNVLLPSGDTSYSAIAQLSPELREAD